MPLYIVFEPAKPRELVSESVIHSCLHHVNILELLGTVAVQTASDGLQPCFVSTWIEGPTALEWARKDLSKNLSGLKNIVSSIF